MTKMTENPLPLIWGGTYLYNSYKGVATPPPPPQDGFQEKKNNQQLFFRSEAIQRAGRAGRTAPGKCLRLYSKYETSF